MGTDNSKDITIPEVTGISRDEEGRFIPGVSGNPNGRPKGAVSVVEAIKNKLKETPEGQTKTYLELLVNRYFKSAIQDGDPNIIRDLINRIDGMPKQTQEISGPDGGPIPIMGGSSNVHSNNRLPEDTEAK